MRGDEFMIMALLGLEPSNTMITLMAPPLGDGLACRGGGL
jgi:hypothetical protein